MSLPNELKRSLEVTYDIPFEVNSGIKDNEPWFEITPARSHDSLFRLLMSYRNGIRLVMKMQPQKYSANMVRAMGAAKDEKKKSFSAFSSIMTRDGAKIDFFINDNTYDPYRPETWPAEWNRVYLRATVMPVEMTADDMPDYKNETQRWGKSFAGMTLSLLDIVPLNNSDESDEISELLSGHEEGKKVRTLANRYERNPINRYICLQNKGYKCSACGFDFEKQYGEIGKDFIHIHHIIPVSQMAEGYVVDPLKDLIPVCPNCHAMIHRADPLLTVEELRSRMTEKR